MSAASAVERLGHTAIAAAAQATHAAASSRAAAQASHGRCTATGCSAPLFQLGLCFDHHRLQQKSNHDGPEPRRAAVATANKATVIELVGSVNKQPAFARMVGYSLECLKKLAVDEVAVEEILEQGTIPALQTALALHPNNEKLHKQYMEALESFAMNGRMAKKVGALLNGNFNQLHASLRNHNDVDTHIATARAMAALASDEGNMDAMADQGGLDALADAVRRNPGNAELLAAAAKVFSKFASYKPEYADYITQSGATEVIIAGMQQHPDHHGLAKNGAELLSILAGGSAANCTSLKRMGAVDALLAALEAHPYDRDIERFATRALAALTGEDDMIASLNVCRGNTALDLAAAKALSKLASLMLVGSNVDSLWKHAGVDWLLAILQTAEGCYDEDGNRMLTAGYRALARAATDANRVYELLRHGAVPLLVSTLNSRTDADVLAAALAALAGLVRSSVSNAANAAYIVRHGGVNAALRAYATHPESDVIVRPALSLLSALSMFEPLGASLAQAGSIEALVDMLRRNQHDASIVVDALTALGRLATCEGHVQRMAAAGLPQLQLDTLKRHGNDVAATRAALLGLEIAALLPSNIPELIRLGAVEAIHAAMACWPLDAEIQSIGRRALALLLRQQEEELERARRAAAERARLEEEERRRREEEERRRMEREMAEALARLKMQDEEEERKRRQQKEWEDNIKLKAMREAQIEQERLAALVAPPKPVSAPAPASAVVVRKSARAIFEADDEDPPVFELDPSIKQFLLAGQMLTKHSKTALPSSKHVYLTQDLTRLIWNKPMTDVDVKHTMLATSLLAVTRGHTTPQLQRVRFGKKLAGPPEHCFSLFGVCQVQGQRTVDLECKTRAECDRWVRALEHLIHWVKTKKLYGADTMQMMSHEKLQRKMKKEEKQKAEEEAAAAAAAGKP